MSHDSIRRLAELAHTDPVVAPLARLQAVVFDAAAAGEWDAGVPPFDRGRLDDGLPLLHGQVLGVDPDQVRALLLHLAAIAGECGEAPGLATVPAALAAPDCDPCAVLRASIRHDLDAMAAIAAETDCDMGVLTTLSGLAALPLLQACGRRAAPLLAGAYWEAGSCPVCAAWPALAEVRGLERRRWLRCGRCAAEWSPPHDGCVFCGHRDFAGLGYLAPEAAAEARRAMTCDNCRSYLKTLTTLGPLDAAEVAHQDLTTLELDMAALEQDYARPDTPGFPLDVQVEPLPAGASARSDRANGAKRRRGWFGRRA